MNTTNFIFLLITFQGSFRHLSKCCRSHQSISCHFSKVLCPCGGFIHYWKKQIQSKNVLFSSSVNWKKAASLDLFRQKAVQQANSHTGRKKWIREKQNKQKEEIARHKDIHTKRVLGEDDLLHRFNLPAGGKRGKQTEGERESCYVKRSRGFRLHSSLHFPAGWGGRLVHQQARYTALLSNSIMGLWEEKRPPVRRLRWKARH